MDSPCKQSAISQISTGQAGNEVNRDLETLFTAVNRLIRCVSRLADFADSQSQGAFSTGGIPSPGNEQGSSSQQFPGRGPASHILMLDSGANLTLPDGYRGVVFVNPTADISVTLGFAQAEDWVRVVNTAASGSGFDIELKDGATVLATIYPQCSATASSFSDSSGAWEWPDVVPVSNKDGTVYQNASMVLLDDAKGLVLQSPNGSYWEVTVDNTGAISTAVTSI